MKNDKNYCRNIDRKYHSNFNHIRTSIFNSACNGETYNAKTEMENFTMKTYHYNRWFTDCIKKYLENIDKEIYSLFEPYISFSKMSLLFGLHRNYLREQRYEKSSKNIIAQNILNLMRKNISQKISEWMELYPALDLNLLGAMNGIIQIIDDYEQQFNPLPTPHYQINKYHPNFNHSYFSEIIYPEQAYWLGFFFADGSITIEHKEAGDYYRLGIGLSSKDYDLLVRFCMSTGLDHSYIKTYAAKCSYTNKKTSISRIRWGDQIMANDLLNLGMVYEFDEEKGHRVKISSLPLLLNEELMLSFLLGFYDGDGSLGLTNTKGGKRIFPSITSSNENFLLELKAYFDLEYSLYPHSYEKYDFKKDIIVFTEGYKLYLGLDLFEKMLQSYQCSLKRKRVSNLFLEEMRMTPQQFWMKERFNREKFKVAIQFISAHRIGNIVGLDHVTITLFVENRLNLQFKSGEYYTGISNSIRFNGKNSEYYRGYEQAINYISSLGKFSKD